MLACKSLSVKRKKFCLLRSLDKFQQLLQSVANFEIGWGAVCHLLGMFELVFIQSPLSYGK